MKSVKMYRLRSYRKGEMWYDTHFKTKKAMFNFLGDEKYNQLVSTTINQLKNKLSKVYRDGYYGIDIRFIVKVNFSEVEGGSRWQEKETAIQTEDLFY